MTFFPAATHFTAPRAGLVAADDEQAAAEQRRTGQLMNAIQILMRSRLALLCRQHAGALIVHEATRMGWPAIIRRPCRNDECDCRDAGAVVNETRAAHWAPRPDLLHRSGGGALKRCEPLRLRQAQLVDATEPGIAARLVR